jgi:imidazolonepropionase
MQLDILLTHAHLVTMAAGKGYGAIADGAVGVRDGKIVWVGESSQSPPPDTADEIIDCAGRLVTPGLIDCHTHLVFGGNRASEFEMRLEGASYADIARAGGGILSTVAATRALDEDRLYEESLPRLHALLAEGVTTVEIKSGYGLDTQNEIKMLRVARRFAAQCPVTTLTTFLGAHALPQEFSGRADAYIAMVCDDMLPAVAAQNLADAVDAFCETIAFTPEQTARVFAAAARHGMRVKLHADQLSDQGGAALAARHRALSAGHLEYASQQGIAAMALAGTVAVLLPGAYYFLRETRLPPIAALRSHGVAMAVASDCNPGSSPIPSLLINMHLACTLFQLTPQEALTGVTLHAARALGVESECGSLETGKRADLAVWDVESPAELCYWMGGVKPRHVIFKGKPVIEKQCI